MSEIIVVPSLWIILEFLRSVVFTGFPWALIGHCQYPNILLIQLADIAGVYGVSFLVVMVNYALFSLIKFYRYKRQHIFLTVVICVVCLFYGFKSYTK